MVIFILKISIKRQRPPHHKTDARFVGPDQHSFPSGHATRALCITRFIFDYSSRNFHSNIRLMMLHWDVFWYRKPGTPQIDTICWSILDLHFYYFLGDNNMLFKSSFGAPLSLRRSGWCFRWTIIGISDCFLYDESLQCRLNECTYSLDTLSESIDPGAKTM